MRPHDQHFKKLLASFFCEFIEAFVPELAGDLDRRHVELLDKELIWIRRHFRKAKFVDLVAKVKLKGTPGFILIHIEHQARRDPAMARRMFLYAAWLLERYGLPVWPVLLTSYAQPRRAEPNRYEMAVRGKPIITFHYTVVQLNRLDWRDFLAQPNPVTAALMVRMNLAPADRVRVKAEILRLLLTLRLRPEKAQLILGFVETYLELTAKEELKLRREIDTLSEYEQDKIMKMLLPGERAGLRKGRQAGRQEGRQEGQLRNQQEAVMAVLETRFGEVPYALRETVTALDDLARLKQWLRLAVQLPSLGAFQARVHAR
jgi:predicted transposase YdaD